MRVLLDESLPLKLKKELVGHLVDTVPKVGWAGKQNGELLALAATRFDVFVTPDQNLQYQQNLSNLPLAVLVLKVRRNRLAEYLPLVPQIQEALGKIQPGELLVIG